MSRLEEARLPRLTTYLGRGACDGEGDPFLVASPVDGSELGRPRASSVGQVAVAVADARSALLGWSATAASARAELLEALALRLLEDRERLAALVTLDNGKTLAEAHADVYAAVALLRSAAGWATRIKGTTLVDDNGLQRMTWREPVGVVAIFMPFNAPLMFCALKIGAALATGNTVVAKSPQQNPYAAAAFLEHLEAVGLPAGVVTLVQGGGDVGAALVKEPDVAMVSFTGSSHVGAIVGAEATRRHKSLILELGGKSANIVYDDADVELAVSGSLGAIFRNAGQRCFSGSRLLVQHGIADRFLTEYVARAASLRVGDPFDPATQVGAVITPGDVDRVLAIVERARAEGARVLCGGRAVLQESGGAYVAPTVIDCTDVPDASVLREEVFGPVVAVQRFADEPEAFALANSTEFALAGGCWTSDLGRAFRTARAVDAGMFWINSYAVHGGVEATIGGRGSSGFGQEMGEEGVLAYTNVKTVLLDVGVESAVRDM